jgi:hypothetical protein
MRASFVQQAPFYRISKSMRIADHEFALRIGRLDDILKVNSGHIRTVRVMAGLAPAIYVFLAEPWEARRGYPRGHHAERVLRPEIRSKFYDEARD